MGRSVFVAKEQQGLPALSAFLASTWGSSDAWAFLVQAIAFLYFAAVSVVLTRIDLASHRLPNSIVLPSYLVAGTLFTFAALLTGEWDSLLRAGVAMAALYLFYFALRYSRPSAMGGGDVKLAGLIGIYLGWTGWGALAGGALAAFVYGGAFGVALMLTRRAGRKTAIPFGPWMLLGAWTGVLFGETAGGWYAGLVLGA